MRKRRQQKKVTKDTQTLLSKRVLHLVSRDNVDKRRALSRMIYTGTEISRRLWNMCARNWVFERNMMEHLVHVMDIQNREEYRVRCEEGLRRVILEVHSRGVKL